VNPRDTRQERIYRALLHLYPAEFRARFSDEMVQLLGDQLRDARTGRAPAGVARTWLRTLGDLVITAASERVRRDRTVAHSLTASPSTSSRVLGLVGILGGAVLLAAFFVDVSPGLGGLRIMLFNVGAMAIVIAVHRRQAVAWPTLAWLGAIPAFLANAWYLVMTLLATDRLHPFGGDFGLLYFSAGLAIWLADAGFGLVTLRLGIVSRLGAVALAIGSVLAITGIDRLGLTSPDNPTIFGPLSLAGAALNGLGWILLGLDIATRRRAYSAINPAGVGTKPHESK
jgi:hypothetical protein